MNNDFSEHSVVALIPARSGSKRIPDKNIKILGEHPLISHTIKAAKESSIFKKIICVTDSNHYKDIAEYYGAEVPKLRPKSISGDFSPDIEWVRWILSYLEETGLSFDAFSILRPTSPFRNASTIRRAWREFTEFQPSHSLRAIQKCKEHPGKMWKIKGNNLYPIFKGKIEDTPYHSSQYSVLPEIYVQNASLEIAWAKVPFEYNSISGDLITPFISKDYEGFDINHLEDWIIAAHYLDKGTLSLPSFEEKPYKIKD